MRIEVPTNADKLIALGKAIKARHESLGAASPLKGIEDFDKFGPLVDGAEVHHTAARNAARTMEAENQLRDGMLGQIGPIRANTVRHFVTAARDVLMGINKGKEQKLGEWTFEVDASPQAARAAKTAKP